MNYLAITSVLIISILIGCNKQDTLTNSENNSRSETRILGFNENLELPGICRLHSRQSIIDDYIRITCDIKNDAELDYLEIKLSDSKYCSVDKFFPTNVMEEVTESENFRKNDKWYYKGQFRFKDSHIVFYKSAISNNEICFDASSTNLKTLDTFTKPVWN